MQTEHVICKRKLTAVCSHQTRIGNLDAHLI
ncbi:truncated TraD [Escherichia coli]|nr:truncated TraD [Escherichia coli]